ncbi:MAG TPA: PQQ-dependent sugar dehydrogenase [Phycisphaerae bacterium]|nr:PQQ-dependent sugar dehydrogenase [Phycisphaerales bacterium]HRX84645.1 PQQ-dependent sugar dehydrogenase [Phycisphaerae bacterium]
MLESLRTFKRFSRRLRAWVCALAIVVPAGAARGVDDWSHDFVVEPAFGGYVFNGASAVRFANNGKVFVAERSGIIKVFDGVDDPTPTVFADLRQEVYAFADRGLLGLAVHPNFSNVPYVYALYTRDAEVGGTVPLWGDTCPTPPGALIDGCVASSRLVRLTASGDTMTGTPVVLIDDWCQQYPSHSAGDLRFGPDGALYVSHGEGANFQQPDYGQLGGNPCGDPPNEGGSLRAQDIRTAGDPVSFHGAILRINALTGTALPNNPLYGGAESGDDRIIAHGLRNPFRFVFRPGTSEIWIGDVGWNTYEEIDRLVDPVGGPVENFGWPCYEGPSRQPSWEALELPICEGLYAEGTAIPPYWSYEHIGNGGYAISGVAFYQGGDYPSAFDGALFFSDWNEAYIRVMFAGSNGLPDPGSIRDFVTQVTPVDLQIGPGGDLFFVNFTRQGPATVQRVVYSPPDRSPAALATCLSGPEAAPMPDPPLTPAECLRAFDCDDDGDVDLRDLVAYQQRFTGAPVLLGSLSELGDCLAGPAVVPAPQLPHLSPASCLEMFDLDGHDADVDLHDFAAFVRAIGMR